MNHSVNEHAFDHIAENYDADFSCTFLGRLLRRRVWNHMEPLMPEIRNMLELGCGTGTDALHFARKNIKVTVTDSSWQMIDQVVQKTKKYGYTEQVLPVYLDMNELPAPGQFRQHIRSVSRDRPAEFDAVFSNFGALNCVKNIPSLAEFLWHLSGSRAYWIAVMMNRYCPIEIAGHLWNFSLKKAFRRFKGGIPAHVGKGQSLPVWYPTPAGLSGQCRPWFEPVAVFGIGCLLPPAYMSEKARKNKKWSCRLYGCETRIAGYFPATILNDHFMIIMRRCDNISN